MGVAGTPRALQRSQACSTLRVPMHTAQNAALSLLKIWN
jgi:hypothetical protein